MSSDDDAASIFAGILKPGSSLNPNFLAVLDGAFVLLFFVFVVLAFLTSGNIHLFVLMGIELALWASVKWVVNELRNMTVPEQELREEKGQEIRKDL